MDKLLIEYLDITSISPYSGNARTHSPTQIAQIARSIRAFGFMNPVLVDQDNRLIAGHGRLEAAKKLGMAVVPAIRFEHLSESERRAYMLADNKIAENAGWDESLLRVEIEYLMQADIDFDVDLTGFSTPEVDLLFAPTEDSDPLDEIPEPPEAPSAVTRPGDIWKLHKHRIACGDCRDPALFKAVLAGEQARMLVTDPPYNVPTEGHIGGSGKHKHPDFEMAHGEMSADEFVSFLGETIGNAKACCQDGAVLYIFMDWRHLGELQAACDLVGLHPINLCVWTKSNGGMGSLYRSQHELVLVLKNGKAPHVNNVQLGKHGRYRTNVWPYAGMNAFGAERDAHLSMHPTVKPVAMIADAIKDVSHRGEIILDGFLGSGATLIAAENTHRRCIGIELDPRYVDVCLARWTRQTGLTPVHVQSGRSFDEIRAERVEGTPSEVQ